MSSGSGRRTSRAAALRQGDLTLYRQMETILREQIALGELKPGDQAPTEAELQAQFGVSRATVRQALDALEKDGLIDRQPGRGTFIRARRSGTASTRTVLSWRAAINLAATADREVRAGAAPAPAHVAGALGVADDADVPFVIRVTRRGPIIAVKRYGAATPEGRVQRVWADAISAEPRFAMMLKTQPGAPLLSLWWIEGARGSVFAVAQMLAPAAAYGLSLMGDAG